MFIKTEYPLLTPPPENESVRRRGRVVFLIFLVFLDEPSCGMDPVARRFLWGVLRDVGTQAALLVSVDFLSTGGIEGLRFFRYIFRNFERKIEKNVQEK